MKGRRNRGWSEQRESVEENVKRWDQIRGGGLLVVFSTEVSRASVRSLFLSTVHSFNHCRHLYSASSRALPAPARPNNVVLSCRRNFIHSENLLYLSSSYLISCISYLVSSFLAFSSFLRLLLILPSLSLFLHNIIVHLLLLSNPYPIVSSPLYSSIFYLSFSVPLLFPHPPSLYVLHLCILFLFLPDSGFFSSLPILLILLLYILIFHSVVFFILFLGAVNHSSRHLHLFLPFLFYFCPLALTILHLLSLFSSSFSCFNFYISYLYFLLIQSSIDLS